MVDSAMGLYDIGLSVFPLRERGKKPIVDTWTKYQKERAPIDVLVQWWREYPNANIAVACGPVSGVLVLDVDGDIGREALEALEGKHGKLPSTWRSLTGKGEHYWFRYPAGRRIGNSAHKLGAGLDTRGQGGYVVAPGSVHENGNEYRWAVPPSEKIAEVPAWLLDIIDPPAKPKPARLIVDNEAAHSDAYLDKAINGEVGRLMRAPEGTRNDQLNRTAFSLGQLVGGGAIDERYVEGLLLRIALQIGLTETESIATIASGIEKGKSQPRGIPPLRFESSRRSSSPMAAAVAASTEVPEDGGLRLVSAAEIALETGQPYLLKGLIHRGDASVLYGQSGCGKTFLALYIAQAIATGRSIFGRRVKQAPVALFALEGSAGLAKRLVASQNTHGSAPDLFVYRKPITLFQNPGILGEVVAGIQDCCAALVIFDTLSRTMAGANENAPEDMTYMVAAFDLIRERTGAHVMLVHHSGKNEANGARGHSSLKAAVDVEMEVENDNGRRCMRVTKGRDDAGGQEYGFNLRVDDLGADDDGDRITTCVVEESLTEPQKKPERAPKLTSFEGLLLKDFNNLPREWVRPEDGMPMVNGVDREALVGELKRKGRLDASPGMAMTAGDRKKVQRALEGLEQKGLINATAKWVWRT